MSNRGLDAVADADVDAGGRRARRVTGGTLRRLLATNRAWALAGAALLSLAPLAVLYNIVNVVGGIASVGLFGLEIVATLALAATLARVLSPRGAIALGAVLLLGGLTVYLSSVPRAYIELGAHFSDIVALLTGLSVLRIAEADVWAIALTPVTLFVPWYFFLREAYGRGVVFGGAALGFFVLTGDVGTVTALVGVVGGAAAVGFGRLAEEGGSPRQRNRLLVVLVAMLVVTTSVSVVPGGEAQPLLPDSQVGTVEGSLINAGDRASVLGSIRLSPEVRFTVTASEGSYWRVGAYDRFTGDGWIRTGRSQAYDESLLDRPEGDDLERIRQTFRAETTIATMPAAWKPVEVGSGSASARITSMGGLQPQGSFTEGEAFTVISLQNRPSPEDLRAAGTDYPDSITNRYLQLPDSTPDRVAEFAANLTADAETPYDAAVRIEQWLETNKEYSLQVNRPEGNIADAFIFEMEQGYCSYYATAMVTMLRSQGIPARFVVGYTPGQRIAEDKWVVRGYDSHAWVEVYFPEEGWVRFDPTPSGPRQNAEQSRLEQARASGAEDVDTDESLESTYTPPTTTDAGQVNGTANVNPGQAPQVQGPGLTDTPDQAGALLEGVNDSTPGVAGFVTTTPATNASAGGGPTLPSRGVLLYGVILLAGLIAALYRFGVLGRAYREVWLRQRPEGDPTGRIEATFERLEYLLGQRHRPREPDETPKEYIEALRVRGVDDRALELYEAYERARYAGRVDADIADRAEQLLEGLLEERSLVGFGGD